MHIQPQHKSQRTMTKAHTWGLCISSSVNPTAYTEQLGQLTPYMRKNDDLTHGLGTSPSLHTVIISYARADASREPTLSSVTTLDHLLSLTLLDPVDLGSVWLKKLE